MMHAYSTAQFVTYTGVIVGLILVFRTNTSYQLYDRGITTIGSLATSVRTIVLQTCGALDQVSGAQDEAALHEARADVRRLAFLALVLTLKHVREDGDLQGPLRSGLIGAQERNILASVGPKTRVTVAVQWLHSLVSRCQQRGIFDPSTTRSMLAALSSFLQEFQVACRIAFMPMPFPYAQVVKLCIAFYVLSMPFALANTVGWATPALVFVISLMCFSIDEIAVELENPLGTDPNDLRLEDTLFEVDVELAELMALADPGASHLLYTGRRGTLLEARHVAFRPPRHVDPASLGADNEAGLGAPTRIAPEMAARLLAAECGAAGGGEAAAARVRRAVAAMPTTVRGPALDAATQPVAYCWPLGSGVVGSKSPDGCVRWQA